MTTEKAWSIIGNQPRWAIKNMIVALSLHSHLRNSNTAEDARRLVAARICLRTPNPRYET